MLVMVVSDAPAQAPESWVDWALQRRERFGGADAFGCRMRPTASSRLHVCRWPYGRQHLAALSIRHGRGNRAGILPRTTKSAGMAAAICTLRIFADCELFFGPECRSLPSRPSLDGCRKQTAFFGC